MCERQRERKKEYKKERKKERKLEFVKHGCQGECFVLWEFSSGCQAPVLEQEGDV